MKKTFKKISIILIIIIIVLYFIEIGIKAPENAIVYINKEDNKYLPPTYYVPTLSENYIQSTLAEAEKNNTQMQENMNDFYIDQHLLFRLLKIPIFYNPHDHTTHFQKRWNENGTWNY
jgi:hypothetical protein